MPSRSVIITYTTHPPSSPLLASAIKGIRAQLPLRNLHWKPSTRTSIRTIQELDVRFIELGEAGSLGKEPGGSVLESPLVHLCLVACENDEVYKNQTRSFIRDWQSLLAAKKGAYVPMIVLVNPSTTGGSGKNVFGRDKGVFGKLKADFNLNKKERCVQLNLPPEGTIDPTVWPDVMNKLKKSIISAFDNVIVEREEDVKRGEAQRLTVGWNFCTWFLLKESLAYSFEGVNLYEDALIVYEELEAAFFQVLKEQNLSWFGKLGATGPKDDSLPILDTDTRPYRELLQKSSISIFDFRIYVFARQAQLLGKIGRITEIAKRGQWFVASLARRLRENEADLAEHFIESWTYSTCMNIVQNCDEWSRIDRPNGDYSGLIAYESARSELLDIARVQTERIGVASGHLPNVYPFAPSSALSTAADNVLFESSESGSTNGEAVHSEPRSTLSNRLLLDAMKDTRTYREMYAHLTRKAVSAYEACGKHNSVIRLKADLATLALLDENWKLAYDLCRHLAKDCADLEVWDKVAGRALAGALRAHRHLGLAFDEDWVNLALAYLRVCALSNGEGELETVREEVQEVLADLAQSNIQLAATAHPAFSVQILDSQSAQSDSTDISTLRIGITNELLSQVESSSILLELEDSAGEQILYSCASTQIPPGNSSHALRCTTSIQGIFYLRCARLYIGAVELVYLVDDPSLSIHIRRHSHGPSLEMKLPSIVALDKDQKVFVEVTAGEWPISGMKVVVESFEPEVSFAMSRAEGSGSTISASENEILIGDLNPRASTSFLVPYHSEAHNDRIRASIRLQYETEGHSRNYIDTQTLSTALPLTVNVQDFFRPTFLVSHFTIASDGRRHLRVRSVELLADENSGHEVTSAVKGATSPSVIVPPFQPLSCLFRIRRNSSYEPSADPPVLRLVISYTSLDEEFETILHSTLKKGKFPAALMKSVRALLNDSSAWLQQYLVSSDAAEVCKSTLKSFAPPEDISEADMESFAKTVEASRENSLPWRRLEIPVELPGQRLLTMAHFEHADGAASVYEGRAISLILHLTSYFDWLDEVSRDLRLFFDIQVNGDDWIVLGKKKGFYMPRRSQNDTFSIVLVPVRAGRLNLPVVQIHPVNPKDSADGSLICETYVDNAAESIEVFPAKSSAMALIPM
ncbi:trafficking protein particle complex subunit 10 [Kockovaella imperatae]|uniref:Trafficking protein particle complex subunit 10 n=1 Tax=Kockovaella imperatae TaxID=4999 RepID=A0A1Y1UCB9_9TREE|nr:trafficking protein particle complex subunit 10 [Kockovaella imperatae]ORX34725.1 trafficking protein particle complex subunit 10 [Kockovaella imperatae]